MKQALGSNHTNKTSTQNLGFLLSPLIHEAVTSHAGHKPSVPTSPDPWYFSKPFVRVFLLSYSTFLEVLFRGSSMVYNMGLEHSLVYLRIISHHITGHGRTLQQYAALPFPSFTLPCSRSCNVLLSLLALKGCLVRKF